MYCTVIKHDGHFNVCLRSQHSLHTILIFSCISYAYTNNSTDVLQNEVEVTVDEWYLGFSLIRKAKDFNRFLS